MADPARAGAAGTGGPGVARPSFTGFWKRSKEEEETAGGGRQLTFVSMSDNPRRRRRRQQQQQQQQQPGGGGGGDENHASHDNNNIHNEDDETAAASSSQQQASGSSSSKSQARRAQVRKAQIQHRQRKANYTKQLEMDVARLRDLIERAQREGAALRTQNGAMRNRLLLAATTTTTTTTTATTTTMPMTSPPDGGGGGGGFVGSSGLLPPQAPTTTAFSTPPAPAYVVSLDLASEASCLDSPMFWVRRESWPPPSGTTTTTSSSDSHHGVGGGVRGGGFTASADGSTSSPLLMAATATTTTAGGATALALGSLTDEQTDQAINFILALEHTCWDHFDRSLFTHDDYDEGAPESGHALMASNLALRGAVPEDTLARIHTCSQQHHHHHQQKQHNRGGGRERPDGKEPAVQWRLPAGANGGPGLTLESLLGLAATLNRPDAELAPVQAWFEMVGMYGLGAAAEAARAGVLVRELAPLVRCVQFGAVIERSAFDSVMYRVLGPALPPLPPLPPGVAGEEGQQQQQQQQGGADLLSAYYGNGGGGNDSPQSRTAASWD
ncbi:hypothetical protein GGR56DRAFT_685681 [Xylariaceae sp. FL0804]|nr:hypothetical protein GGR56DRAFT_685681 [Xylariaceae sp. FL0804]